ncbi:MAG TPA: DUF2007 domain-containing protein [Gemmataceae bacterium]|jgi:hypothetical protein|nr:DUF2007 domain-containing protein [Gemmataceae bacterium]
MDPLDLVEVYRAKNNVQATLFQQALEDAGIRATIENGLLTGGTAELIGWATNPRIVVESKDEGSARQVIKQSEHLEAVGAEARVAGEDFAACLACGAPMRTGVATCPVCGWSYVKDESASDK